MLRKVGRLLLRLRPAPPTTRPAVVAPRQWGDELSEAGTTRAEWVARRVTSDAVYVNVGDAVLDRLRHEHPVLVQATVDAASKVLRHEFDLLGSGPFTPDDPERAVDADGYRPIDWFLDPVSGLRFPRVPLSAWNFEQLRPGRADIKLPWELARCQHWPLLGQAYRLTADDRYALEIARELRDFMEANPIGTAVNWACTMDVALRAANWTIALDLVHSCAALTCDFWSFAYQALFDHGTFIESHLENTYEVTSNHFLSNVVGLFFLAAAFDDLPRGQAWDRQCRSWLATELGVQVLPDGADYESSVPYHRLVTELFLGAARLAIHKGDPLPSHMHDRLQKMIDYLAAVERPDGLMPQIGDADDGRLHVLSGYGAWQPQDARHLFGPAAALFHRAAWTRPGRQNGDRRTPDSWTAWEAAWWGLDAPTDSADESLPSDTLEHFPQAGVTVMRRRRDYLIVTNGIVGTGGFGNHKHNDLLGFEYHIDDVAVFVDPGSYVYTSDPDARNLFRSTAFHNTLSIDGEEQNDIQPEWLFRTFEKANPEHLEVERGDGLLRYRGRHRGYARLAQPVVHERTFTLGSDRALTIVDVLTGSGSHRFRWHFHLSPGVEVLEAASGALDIRVRGAMLRMTTPGGLRRTISPAWYSPSYGVRTACVALDFEVNDRLEDRREYVWRVAS